MNQGWHEAYGAHCFRLGDIKAELSTCWSNKAQCRIPDMWEMWCEGAWRFREQKGLDKAKARTLRWIAKNLKAKVKEISAALAALEGKEGG